MINEKVPVSSLGAPDVLVNLMPTDVTNIKPFGSFSTIEVMKTGELDGTDKTSIKVLSTGKSSSVVVPGQYFTISLNNADNNLIPGKTYTIKMAICASIPGIQYGVSLALAPIGRLAMPYQPVKVVSPSFFSSNDDPIANDYAGCTFLHTFTIPDGTPVTKGSDSLKVRIMTPKGSTDQYMVYIADMMIYEEVNPGVYLGDEFIGYGKAQCVAASNMNEYTEFDLYPDESVKVKYQYVVGEGPEVDPKFVGFVSSNSSLVAVAGDQITAVAANPNTIVTIRPVFENLSTSFTNRPIQVKVVPRPEDPDKITIKSPINLKVGDSVQAEVTFVPTSTKQPFTRAVSSDPSVASINLNGKVTAHSAGSTDVYVGVGEVDSGWVRVNVTEEANVIPVTKIELNSTQINIAKDDPKYQLVATTFPENATNKTVFWSTDDDTAISVSVDGYITIKKTSVTANVFAKTPDGKVVASCKVNTWSTSSVLKYVDLSMDFDTITIGQTAKLNLSYVPNYVTEYTKRGTFNIDLGAEYITLNEANQTVTGKAYGQAWIHFQSAIAGVGKSRMQVPVANPSTLPTSITITSEPVLDLLPGDQDYVVTMIEPSSVSPDNKKITLTSSDTTVATIASISSSAGEVTAVGPGTATIMARTINDLTATVQVNVKENTVPPLTIRVIPNTLTLKEKANYTLTSVFTPDNADKTITWMSNNPTIASVGTNGFVTGNKAGTTEIVATAVNGLSDVCVVTVESGEVLPSSVSVTPTYKTASIDDTFNVSASVNPADATNKKVTWSSTNTTIATVDSNGRVICKAKGTADIIGTTYNGKTGVCKLTINEKSIVPVESVTIVGDDFTLKEKETKQLLFEFLPAGSSDTFRTWSLSEPSVCSISSTGLVTGLKSGFTWVMGITTGGKYTPWYAVTVEPGADHVYPTGVSMTLESTSIGIGKQTTATATVIPANATNQNVTWDSGTPSVATVDQYGVIRGLKAGTSRITVYTSNSLADSKEIKVKAEVARPITDLVISPQTPTLVVESTIQMTASVVPSDTTDVDKSVSWVSSNTQRATVSASGVVKGVSVGTATITAKSKARPTVKTSTVVTVAAKVIPVTSVTVYSLKNSVPLNETAKVHVFIEPDDASDKAVEWETSPLGMAEVVREAGESGASGWFILTPKKLGNYKLICRSASQSDMSDSVDMENTEIRIPLTKISMVRADQNEIEVGDKATYYVNLLPTDTTMVNVSTKVEPSNIGYVTKITNDTYEFVATSAGNCVITTTGENGVTGTLALTVKAPIVIIPVTKVELQPASHTMEIGSSQQISAIVTPSNASDTSLTWTSTDSSVAVVDSFGVASGVGAGMAKIIAKSVYGPAGEAQLTINRPYVKVDSIVLTPSSAKLGQTEFLKVTAHIRPDDATSRVLSWTSSNPDVATVDQTGMITGIAPGNCIVTVSATTDKISTELRVEVTKRMIPVSNVELEPKVKTIDINERFAPEVTIQPTNATDRKIFWTTSDPRIADVTSYGEVVGRGQGKATITATARLADGKAAPFGVCEVTVLDTPNVLVDEILILPDSKQLEIGQWFEPHALIRPETAINKTLMWMTDNPDVLYVSLNDGMSRALKSGHSNLVAMSSNGIVGICKITVKEQKMSEILKQSDTFEIWRQKINAAFTRIDQGGVTPKQTHPYERNINAFLQMRSFGLGEISVTSTTTLDVNGTRFDVVEATATSNYSVPKNFTGGNMLTVVNRGNGFQLLSNGQLFCLRFVVNNAYYSWQYLNEAAKEATITSKGIVQLDEKVTTSTVKVPTSKAVWDALPIVSSSLTSTSQTTVASSAAVKQLKDDVDSRVLSSVYNLELSGIRNEVNANQHSLIGIPMPFPSNSKLPSGYMAMNGQDIPLAYTRLRELYGNKLPDMRDRYIRGANGTRGGSPLTLQDDAIRNIVGKFGNSLMSDLNESGEIEEYSGAFYKEHMSGTNKGSTSGGRPGIKVGFNAARVVPTANENRPFSITFNYICLAG